MYIFELQLFVEPNSPSTIQTLLLFALICKVLTACSNTGHMYGQNKIVQISNTIFNMI